MYVCCALQAAVYGAVPIHGLVVVYVCWVWQHEEPPVGTGKSAVKYMQVMKTVACILHTNRCKNISRACPKGHRERVGDAIAGAADWMMQLP